MNIKNINLLSLLTLFFVIGCSQSDMTEGSNEGPVYQGPFYNEFLACSPGPDYSDDNATEMLAEWKKLEHSEDLLWAGVYAPNGDNNKYDNGWWELMWSSKEAADKAWSDGPSEEFMGWSEKYSSVITCDGEGRFPWTFYLPRPADSFGEVEGENGYFASEFLECKFNEGKKGSDMRKAVVEFNTYLDGIESGPYFYGVYYPEFENSDADILWGNWHSDFETKAAGNADWLENGKEMQAKFDEVVTCGSPDLYDSYMLLNNTEE